MRHDPFALYCGNVCVMIRWRPYRAAVTRELTAHMEDHADALLARGVDPDDAKEQAAAAMGDPYVLGRKLDALHSPWYPRLSRIFTVPAVLLLLIAGMVRLNSSTPYPAFAPFADPAELLQTHAAGVALTRAHGVGGGSIGAYRFSHSAAAAICKSDYTGEDGAPIYYLELVLSAHTPWFWLSGPDCSYLPGRLSDTSHEYMNFRALDEQGLFRRFCLVSIPVEPPFRSSYTFAFGDGGAVSYTVTPKEVPVP